MLEIIIGFLVHLITSPSKLYQMNHLRQELMSCEILLSF